jgi:hypothetical protein
MPKIEIKDLEKQKRQLKASFDMWEKTINDTIDAMKNARLENNVKKYTEDQIEEKVEMLRNGQQDVIDKWIFLGGTIDELRGEKKSAKPVVKKKATGKTVMEQIAEVNPEVPKVEKKEDKPEPVRRTQKAESVSSLIPKMDESIPMA